MTILFIAGTAVLFALQFLDWLSTKRAIDSGQGHEANPLFKWLPVDKIWIVKLLFVPIVAGFWFAGWPYGYIGLLLLNIVGAVIVYSNFRIANGKQGLF